jgi:thioesterase superfamily protein 4
MDDAVIAELSSIPWAAALINDRKWTVIRTSSRSPKPTGEDSFFAETLSTDRTIRSILTFRPTQEEEDDLAYKEIKTIVDLGAGLNGYPQIVHGGFAATLLDEACGILVMLIMDKKVQRQRDLGQTVARPNYFTACK